MANVVSFINYKGGVGKTTVSVEVAATLSREHSFKVLVVDLDPQTNASFYLVSEEDWENWVDDNGSLKDIFESAIRGETFDVQSCIMKDRHGVDLLPSHLDLLPMISNLLSSGGRIPPMRRRSSKISCGR